MPRLTPGLRDELRTTPHDVRYVHSWSAPGNGAGGLRGWWFVAPSPLVNARADVGEDLSPHSCCCLHYPWIPSELYLPVSELVPLSPQPWLRVTPVDADLLYSASAHYVMLKCVIYNNFNLNSAKARPSSTGEGNDSSVSRGPNWVHSRWESASSPQGLAMDIERKGGHDGGGSATSKPQSWKISGACLGVLHLRSRAERSLALP